MTKHSDGMAAFEYSDGNSAPQRHNQGCDEWCAHCALCGKWVLYGARCREHLGVYPETQERYQE